MKVDNVLLRAMLYRTTRDTISNAAFRKAVEGQGPAIAIICTNDNHIFGVYSSTGWTNMGNWQRDEKIFLFSLADGSAGKYSLKTRCQCFVERKPQKCLVKKEHIQQTTYINMIYQVATYGIYIGPNPDLHV